MTNDQDQQNPDVADAEMLQLGTRRGAAQALTNMMNRRDAQKASRRLLDRDRVTQQGHLAKFLERTNLNSSERAAVEHAVSRAQLDDLRRDPDFVTAEQQRPQCVPALYYSRSRVVLK
jgi:hypothetical protein